MINLDSGEHSLDVQVRFNFRISMWDALKFRIAGGAPLLQLVITKLEKAAKRANPEQNPIGSREHGQPGCP